MAALRELIIKISANSQSFQSEIARASRMGADYYRTMQNGGRQAAAAARESERALSDLTAGFASAGKAAAAASAAFATGKIVQIADEWNSVNARLKQASSSADDFAASQRQLMEISQRTGTAFADNANLFSRAAASMREYGYSSDEVLKITEAVSTGLKLSGANTRKRVLLSLNSARRWHRAFFVARSLTLLTNPVTALSAHLPPEWAWPAKTSRAWPIRGNLRLIRLFQHW